MRMKKISKMIIFSLLFTLLMGTQISAATNTLKVSTVSSLKSSKGIKKNTISLKKDTLESITSFKVKKAGTTKITVNNQNTGNSTSISVEIFLDIKCQKSIDPVGMPHISQGTTQSSEFYLEKGTYYFRIRRNDHNEGSYKSGTINVSISLLKSSSTEKLSNSTFEKPETLSLGKKKNGFFTYIDREDYYMFKLTKKSNINISVTAQKTNNETVVGSNSIKVSTYK